MGKPTLQVMHKVDDQNQLLLAQDVISAAKLHTIRDLKMLLSERQGFAVEQQVLYFENTIFADDKILTELDPRADNTKSTVRSLAYSERKNEQSSSATQRTFTLFLLIAQDLCPLNVNVVCTKTTIKGANTLTVPVVVYASATVSSLKPQILSQASQFGVNEEHELHYFLKKGQICPTTYLFELLADNQRSSRRYSSNLSK